jgi:hypothetical protein
LQHPAIKAQRLQQTERLLPRLIRGHGRSSLRESGNIVRVALHIE